MASASEPPGSRGSAASSVLLGSDHTAYGEIAIADVAPGLAVAITRGAFPKGYPHVDPNEDAALAAVGAHGTLLCVADGHNGVEAAEAAIQALHAEAPRLLEGGAARLEDALERARLAVGAAAARLEPPRRDTGTALIACLVSGSEVVVGSAGDAAALLVRGRRADVLGGASAFLTASSRAGAFRLGSAALQPRDVLVLLTDGVYVFLGRQWQRRVAAACREHDAAGELAGALLSSAGAGGAGDNGAVAVYRVPGSRA